MLIGSGVLYVCFAESTLQDWNGHSTRADDKELQLLNKEAILDNKNNCLKQESAEEKTKENLNS